MAIATKVIKMANLKLFDLNFFAGSKAEFLDELNQEMSTKIKVGAEPPVLVFTPNPEQIVMADQSPAFCTILKKADFLIPDGIGVVKASRLFKTMAALKGKSRESLTERIAGVEVVQDLLVRYKDDQVLLIGGRDYHASAQKIQKNTAKNKDIPDTISFLIKEKEVAWFTGYQSVGFASAEDEQKIRLVLRKLKPAIVFVAFGAPDQEEWIVEHLKLMQQEGVKMVMAVGGSFDVLTGKLKRAPNLWQKLGFEWLFRLIQEPTRWKRQLRLITFVGLAFRESLKT